MRILLDLARGNTAGIKPFSNRILHVFIASFISENYDIEIENSFYLIGIISLSVLLGSVILLLNKIKFSSPINILLMLFTPFTMYLFQSHINPDLFYSFIFSVFIIFLFYKKNWSILFFIPILFLTRESTILISIILIIILLVNNNKVLLLLTSASTLIAILLFNFFTDNSVINVHGLNSLLYLPMKFIYNSLFNIFGIELYANTFNYGIATASPIYKFDLPTVIQFGDFKEIGIMAFDFSKPMETLFLFLTYFGIWPLIVMHSIKFDNKILSKDLFLSLIIVYGLISFIITPFLGASIYRLMGYSWPLFWIGLPYLLKDYNINQAHINYFIYNSFLVSWAPPIIYRLFHTHFSYQIFSIFFSIVIYFIVHNYIKKNKINFNFQ